MSLLKLIGRGTYGSVYHIAEYRGKKDVGAKVFNATLDFNEEMKGFDLMKDVTGVWYPQFRGCDAENRVIFMDYVPGPRLSDVTIAPDGFEMAVRLLQSLMCNLMQLGAHGIVHGDIKGNNLIVDPETMEVVLIDFGMTSRVGEGSRCQYHPIYRSLRRFLRDVSQHEDDVNAGMITFIIMILPNILEEWMSCNEYAQMLSLVSMASPEEMTEIQNEFPNFNLGKPKSIFQKVILPNLRNACPGSWSLRQKDSFVGIFADTMAYPSAVDILEKIVLFQDAMAEESTQTTYCDKFQCGCECGC